MSREWQGTKLEPYYCDTCKCTRLGPHFCPGEYDPEIETAPGVLKVQIEETDEIQSTGD